MFSICRLAKFTRLVSVLSCAAATLMQMTGTQGVLIAYVQAARHARSFSFVASYAPVFSS